jgi:hypothetical protein
MFCFYYRFLIHRKMDRLEIINGSTLSRHLCRCAACREYDGRMTRIGEQLKEAACGPLSQAGAGHIEASVLRAFAMVDTARHPTRSRIPLQMRRQMPYAVAAGFVMTAGLFGWLYWTHQHNINDAIAAKEAVASFNQAAALGDNVSLLSLLSEHPARQEMTKLVNDAQQAVIYLTNCIPQGPSGLGTLSSERPDIPNP